MPWTIDDDNAEWENLNTSEENKYNSFRNAVANGAHPKNAAEEARATPYKKLKGSNNQYQIRLSRGNRATFTVNEGTESVTVHQVGGHT